MTSSNTSHPCDVTQEGLVTIGQPLFGVPQLWQREGVVPEIVSVEGLTLHLWSDGNAEWCFIPGILPTNPALRREDQTRNCFERIEKAVAHAGMTFKQVARTWFFNHRILEWYGEFNMVRTLFFGVHGIDPMPASTGVGMPNAAGAALSCAALAIRPLREGVTVREVLSPEQCSAMDYKSSFSRAMALDTPDRLDLWISGTASIAPCGATQFVDNVDKQVDRTLEVVEALLRAERMDWSHITRAVGYFKHAADVARFEAIARTRSIPPFPIVFAHADICRDDLLFELEADAVKIR